MKVDYSDSKVAIEAAEFVTVVLPDGSEVIVHGTGEAAVYGTVDIRDYTEGS
jgi:hypothetical protein